MSKKLERLCPRQKYDCRVAAFLGVTQETSNSIEEWAVITNASITAVGLSLENHDVYSPGGAKRRRPHPITRKPKHREGPRPAHPATSETPSPTSPLPAQDEHAAVVDPLSRRSSVSMGKWTDRRATAG